MAIGQWELAEIDTDRPRLEPWDRVRPGQSCYAKLSFNAVVESFQIQAMWKFHS
jgi:hypothetical protein